MPISTPEVYADMLDRAKAGGFAYPAISSVVGPGTGSAMSYQCASCEGQK